MGHFGLHYSLYIKVIPHANFFVIYEYQLSFILKLLELVTFMFILSQIFQDNFFLAYVVQPYFVAYFYY